MGVDSLTDGRQLQRTSSTAAISATTGIGLINPTSTTQDPEYQDPRGNANDAVVPVGADLDLEPREELFGQEELCLANWIRVLKGEQESLMLKEIFLLFVFPVIRAIGGRSLMVFRRSLGSDALKGP